MANRYWRGGSGTWDASNTANWSTTSGGAGGASVPTAADAVFFDQAATYTVTVTVGTCLSMSVSAGTVTFSGSGNTITVSGSVTMVAATVWSSGPNIKFAASGTLTTNGVTIGGQIIVNNAQTLTLGSALTSSNVSGTSSLAAIYLLGSLTTSNFNITHNVSSTANDSINIIGGTQTLGSSTLSLASNFSNIGTITAGTSTINMTTAGATFASGNSTYYNVSFATAAETTNTLTGAATFNNLTLNAVPTAGICTLTLSSNITVNGTLTTTAGSTVGSRRHFITSNTIGTARTITAAAVSLTDTDFYYITGAGTATWSGTRLGNVGGNTSITFPATKTVYYVAATAGNWSASNWATSSGGATAAANFPLPQDTATIDNNSGTGTLTIDQGYNIGIFTASARSTSLTISNSVNTTQVVGNFTLSSSITLSGGTFTFVGVSKTQTFTPSTATVSSSIALNGSALTFTLASNLTTTGTFTVSSTSSLNLANFTLSVFAFISSGTSTRTYTFGTGQITLTGNAATILNYNSSGVTVSGTFKIQSTYSGSVGTRTFALTGQNVNANGSVDVIIGTAGTDSVAFTGTVGNLDFTGFTGTWSNTGFTIAGNLTTVVGMTVGSGGNTVTFSGGNITSNGKTFDFPINVTTGSVVLQDALTVGSSRTTTLTSGTLNLNSKTLTTGTFVSNSSTTTRTLAFGTGNITVTGTGTCVDFSIVWNVTNLLTITGTAVINCTYSGSSAMTISLDNQSLLNVISYNFTGGTYTLNFLNVNQANYANNVDFTGFSGTLAAITGNNSGQASYIYGNITFSSTMTVTTSNGFLALAGAATKTVKTNGCVIDCNVSCYNNAGYQLLDNLTQGSARLFYLYQTTSLDLNGKTLTVGSGGFQTNGTGTKTLTFNGGTIVCTGSTTTAFDATAGTLTTVAGTGTGKISMTGSSAKTFVGAGRTYNCTLSNDGAGALTISGSNTFTTLANGVQPTTFTFTASTTQTVTNFNISGTAGNLVTINSSSAGTRATLSKSSGTVTAKYLNIKDSAATGGATWIAQFSTNSGNNTGWIFSIPSNFFMLF